MDQSLKDTFLLYEELKLEEKAIKERLDELTGELMDHVNEDEKLQAVHGSFTKGKRVSYLYSEELQQKEEELKAEKKHEEIEGTAQPKKVTYFLQYRRQKEA